MTLSTVLPSETASNTQTMDLNLLKSWNPQLQKNKSKVREAQKQLLKGVRKPATEPELTKGSLGWMYDGQAKPQKRSRRRRERRKSQKVPEEGSSGSTGAGRISPSKEKTSDDRKADDRKANVA
ncbi:U2-type spliceosomal complex subunit CWC25 Ecym_2067 [Eremothecium cymbalariae DBVPG|uniref:Pre-mRNA-splicing factor CWC25 n=1 Tax=Eremothecium cymbalariae (strain CBS 270.75 / DBVPG 7215 / KCTC 17166 / NRRL Y-17582) TaxID=931890 RepID=G8JP24_ERECY|nr:Hypothetical protein Ecym_2067 [Eremothecium cymbalariae DBVPG\